MAVRAANWALLGLLFTGAVWAAEPSAPAPAADSYPVATAMRLGGDEAQTRFVMDLSRKIDVYAFTLADPYRVVLDIPQVIFRLPPKAGETGHGLIKAFRFGLMMEGGSRLVFDVVKPVRVEKAVGIEAANGDPARLLLELAPTDRASFLRQIARDTAPMRAQSSADAGRAAADSRDPRPLVVLDPGHGGIDTGTVSPNGEMEKTIVLDVAKRVRDRIVKTGKYRVLMTRTDDTYVPLDERVRIARKAGAALFVSIHADSLPHREGDARGATVYTLSDKASDSEAAEVADKENRVDVIAGVDLKAEPDDVAGILIDLAQRETKSFSLQFAHRLVNDMKGTVLLHREPIKSAGFRVLRAPDVPSVLVELGYVSNRQDLNSLMSDQWRDRTADSIEKAVDAYLSTHVATSRNGAN